MPVYPCTSQDSDPKRAIFDRRFLALFAVLVHSFLLAGCALGPRQIDKGRIKYNQAIQRTHQEEMLLNLVRLKYREFPEFVSVDSVAAQYTWDGTASLSGELEEANPGLFGLGAAFRRTESPTISYVPRDDQEFNQALISPISIETLGLLMRTGWSAERILRCTVQNVNGVDNATTAGGPTPARKPEFETFRYLTQLIRVLQLQRSFELAFVEREQLQMTPLELADISEATALNALDRGYRFRQDEQGSWQLYMPEEFAAAVFSPEALASYEGQEILRLLQLVPGRTTYELGSARFGQIQPALVGLPEFSIPRHLPCPEGHGNRETIAFSTRSLLEMMFYLSQAVQIPEEHLQQGLVTITVDAMGQPFDWTDMTGDLFRVFVSKKKPASAAVAIPFRGYWYYIHESDMESRSTFLLLLVLFSIETQAGGVRGMPVLTLGI